MAERQAPRPEDAAAQAEAALSALPPQARIVREAIQPTEAARLDATASQTDRTVAELGKYAEELEGRLPAEGAAEAPAERGVEAAPEETARAEETLAAIESTGQRLVQLAYPFPEVHARYPELGDSFNSELQRVGDTLIKAREALGEGNAADAAALVQQADAMLGRVERVLAIEAKLVSGDAEGAVGGAQFSNVMLSLEGALRDFGTANEARGEAVLKAVELYADNIQLYSVGADGVGAERDFLLGFIGDRGFDSREGSAYETAQEDAATLRELEGDVAKLRDTARQNFTELLTQESQDLQSRIEERPENDAVRARLQELKDGTDSALQRLGSNDEAVWSGVTLQEVESLSNRYVLLVQAPGEPRALSEEDEARVLGTQAAALRGRGTDSDSKARQEGTPEWFGQKALDALGLGDNRLAELAVNIGLLQQSAMERNSDALTYLGEREYYRSMQELSGAGTRHSVGGDVEERLVHVNDALIKSELDGLEARYGEAAGRESDAAKERRERVLAIVEKAAELISPPPGREADRAGALRLLDMAREYAALLESVENGFQRGWKYSDEMEAAIDAELGGVDSSTRFSNAVARYEMSAKLDETRRAAQEQFGDGLSRERGVALDALDKIDGLLSQGKLMEAANLYVMVNMYLDAVAKSGRLDPATGKVETLDARFNGSRMEQSMSAFAEALTVADEQQAAARFMDSYNESQRAAAGREIERLQALALSVGALDEGAVGSETLRKALDEAGKSARSASGDFSGVFSLLNLVERYLGAAEPGAYGPDEWPGNIMLETMTVAEIDAAARAGGWETVAEMQAQGYAIYPPRQAGWRYREMRQYQYADGVAEGSAAMISALGAEMRGEHDEALSRFRDGSAHLAETVGLLQEQRVFEDDYSSLRIQSGAQREGYALDLTLDDLVRYEEEDTDPFLRFGGDMSREQPVPTIQELFEQCENSAMLGDVEEYKLARQDLADRIELVAARIARSRDIDKLEENLERPVMQRPAEGEMPAANQMLLLIRMAYIPELSQARPSYEVPETTALTQLQVPYAGTRERLDALEQRAQELATKLDNVRQTGEALTDKDPETGISYEEEYLQLRKDIEEERRISAGYMFISDQLALAGRYIQYMDAQDDRGLFAGKEEIAGAAKANLEASQHDLELARESLLIGNTEGAEQHYREAIEQRRLALAYFGGVGQTMEEAESEIIGTYGESLPPGLDTRAQARATLEGSLTRMYQSLQFYADDQMQAFSSVLRPGSVEGDGSAFARGARIIEESILSLPVGRVVTMYGGEVQKVRELVIAGNLQEAQQLVTETQETARTRQQWEQLFINVGVALLAFVPEVGPIASGLIFGGMMVDQAIVEYRQTGMVSITTSLMLGSFVATTALGAVAGALRQMGAVEEVLFPLEFAAREISFGVEAWMLTESYATYKLQGDVLGAMSNVALLAVPRIGHLAGETAGAAIQDVRARSAEARMVRETGRRMALELDRRIGISLDLDAARRRTKEAGAVPEAAEELARARTRLEAQEEALRSIDQEIARRQAELEEMRRGGAGAEAGFAAEARIQDAQQQLEILQATRAESQRLADGYRQEVATAETRAGETVQPTFLQRLRGGADIGQIMFGEFLPSARFEPVTMAREPRAGVRVRTSEERQARQLRDRMERLEQRMADMRGQMPELTRRVEEAGEALVRARSEGGDVRAAERELRDANLARNRAVRELTAAQGQYDLLRGQLAAMEGGLPRPAAAAVPAELRVEDATDIVKEEARRLNLSDELTDEMGRRAANISAAYEEYLSASRLSPEERRATIERLESRFDTAELAFMGGMEHFFQEISAASSPQEAARIAANFALDFEQFRQLHPEAAPGEAYHTWEHSANAARTEYQLAIARGLTADQAMFLSQVALLHDIDPPLSADRPDGRRPGTPARVEATLAWMQSGEGRQLMLDQWGWTNQQIDQATAIIARTAFPLDAAAQARYEGMVRSIGERYGTEAMEFVLREAPILSEYADKSSYYFAGPEASLPAVRGLGSEARAAGAGFIPSEWTTRGFLDTIGNPRAFATDIELARKLLGVERARAVEEQLPGIQDALSLLGTDTAASWNATNRLFGLAEAYSKITTTEGPTLTPERIAELGLSDADTAFIRRLNERGVSANEAAQEILAYAERTASLETAYAESVENGARLSDARAAELGLSARDVNFIEALRARGVEAPETTRYVRGFAEEGARFENAYADYKAANPSGEPLSAERNAQLAAELGVGVYDLEFLRGLASSGTTAEAAAQEIATYLTETNITLQRIHARFSEAQRTLSYGEEARVVEAVRALRTGQMTIREFWEAVSPMVEGRGLTFERGVPTLTREGRMAPIELQGSAALRLFIQVTADALPEAFANPATTAGAEASSTVSLTFIPLDLIRQNRLNALSFDATARSLGDINVYEYFQMLQALPAEVNARLSANGIDAFVTTSAFGSSSDEASIVVVSRTPEAAEAARRFVDEYINGRYSEAEGRYVPGVVQEGGYTGYIGSFLLDTRPESASALWLAAEGRGQTPAILRDTYPDGRRVKLGAAEVSVSAGELSALAGQGAEAVDLFIVRTQRLAESRMGMRTAEGAVEVWEGSGIPTEQTLSAEIPENRQVHFLSEEARADGTYLDDNRRLVRELAEPPDRRPGYYRNMDEYMAAEFFAMREGSVVAVTASLSVDPQSAAGQQFAALGADAHKTYGATVEGRIGLTVSNLPSQASGDEFLYVHRRAAQYAAEQFARETGLEVKVMQNGPGPDFVFHVSGRELTAAETGHLLDLYRTGARDMLAPGFEVSASGLLMTGAEINFDNFRAGVRLIKNGVQNGDIVLPPASAAPRVFTPSELPLDYQGRDVGLDGVGNVLGAFFTPGTELNGYAPLRALVEEAFGGAERLATFERFLRENNITIRNFEDLRVAVTGCFGEGAGDVLGRLDRPAGVTDPAFMARLSELFPSPAADTAVQALQTAESRRNVGKAEEGAPPAAVSPEVQGEINEFAATAEVSPEQLSGAVRDAEKALELIDPIARNGSYSAPDGRQVIQSMIAEETPFDPTDKSPQELIGALADARTRANGLIDIIYGNMETAAQRADSPERQDAREQIAGAVTELYEIRKNIAIIRDALRAAGGETAVEGGAVAEMPSFESAVGRAVREINAERGVLLDAAGNPIELPGGAAEVREVLDHIETALRGSSESRDWLAERGMIISDREGHVSMMEPEEAMEIAGKARDAITPATDSATARARRQAQDFFAGQSMVVCSDGTIVRVESPAVAHQIMRDAEAVGRAYATDRRYSHEFVTGTRRLAERGFVAGVAGNVMQSTDADAILFYAQEAIAPLPQSREAEPARYDSQMQRREKGRASLAQMGYVVDARWAPIWVGTEAARLWEAADVAARPDVEPAQRHAARLALSERGLAVDNGGNIVAIRGPREVPEEFLADLESAEPLASIVDARVLADRGMIMSADGTTVQARGSTSEARVREAHRLLDEMPEMQVSEEMLAAARRLAERGYVVDASGNLVDLGSRERALALLEQAETAARRGGGAAPLPAELAGLLPPAEAPVPAAPEAAAPGEAPVITQQEALELFMMDYLARGRQGVAEFARDVLRGDARAKTIYDGLPSGTRLIIDPLLREGYAFSNAALARIASGEFDNARFQEYVDGPSGRRALRRVSGELEVALAAESTGLQGEGGAVRMGRAPVSEETPGERARQGWRERREAGAEEEAGAPVAVVGAEAAPSAGIAAAYEVGPRPETAERLRGRDSPRPQDFIGMAPNDEAISGRGLRYTGPFKLEDGRRVAEFTMQREGEPAIQIRIAEVTDAELARLGLSRKDYILQQLDRAIAGASAPRPAAAAPQPEAAVAEQPAMAEAPQAERTAARVAEEQATPQLSGEEQVIAEAQRLGELYDSWRGSETEITDKLDGMAIIYISEMTRIGETREQAIQEAARAAVEARRYLGMMDRGDVPATVEDVFFTAGIERGVRAGDTREVAAFELANYVDRAAQTVEGRVRSGEPRADAREQGIAGAAWENARANGRREPSAEDYRYGALLESVAGHVEADFMQGMKDIMMNAPPERREAALVEYARTAVALADRLPASLSSEPGATRNIFELAALLHTSGVRDATTLLTNAEHTGLFDLIPASGQDWVSVFDTTAEAIMHRIYDIPTEKRATAAGQLLTLMNADAARLPVEQRWEYLTQIVGYSTAREGTFKWSPELESALADLSGRGARRPPLLLYTMAYGTNEPSLLNLAASKDMRQAMGTQRNYHATVEFLMNVRTAQLDGTYGAKLWLAAVRNNLDYLSLDAAARGRAGITETLEDARRSFFGAPGLGEGKVRLLSSLWHIYTGEVPLPGGMSSIVFTESATILSGTRTTGGFSTIAEFEAVSSMLAEAMGVPPALVSSNPTMAGEISSYRMNLEKQVANRSRLPFIDYAGHPEAFETLIPVFDEAVTAQAEGRFLEFKYQGFRDELSGEYGEQGGRLFDTWSQEATYSVSAGGATYGISETGSFEQGFYSGRVRGDASCQDPRNQHHTVAAVVGTIELPWVRQIVITPPDSTGPGDVLYRRKLVLLHGDDGRPVLLVQPTYADPRMPTEQRDALDAAVVQELRAKYEPLGVEVRVITDDVDTMNDSGVNTGYSTFFTGRAPLFYLDSNMHTFESPTRGDYHNGLHQRREGESVAFPPGWSSHQERD